MLVFFKNGPSSASFYFRLFKQTLQFVQPINVKNVHPVYGAGFRTHDFSEHESPPITIRPGLPPIKMIVF